MKGLLVSILYVAFLLSGFATLSVAWECRQLANRLMQLELQEQQLQTVWGKLLLEEAALAALPRVEMVAREQMDMDVPNAGNIRMLAP